ncbi:Alpha/Beta hydrolase protein [Mycena rebaudengoi]|nr:Alpha/Beta hydrolase protein [Mycena rebaudengoi]
MIREQIASLQPDNDSISHVRERKPLNPTTMATSSMAHAKYLLPLFPPLLLASYYLLATPRTTPKASESRVLPLPADPGLASLPSESHAREVYPEDWIEGGAYLQLPLGRLRYWLVGPSDGKKIVLIHGLTIPAIAFTRLAPLLAAAGFRVLLYDLYGRGYSDAPRGASDGIPYDAALYATQLALLLQHLEWRKTRVLGYSMGGGISAALVCAFPALVEREVVLLASTGVLELPPAPPPSPIASLAASVKALVFKPARPVSIPGKQLTPTEEIVPLQSAALRGFSHAVRSSLREGPITRMHWLFDGPRWWAGRRVLIVHGPQDAIVPLKDAFTIKALLDGSADAGAAPAVSLVQIAGAGHDLPWTHADELARAVIEFMEGS